MSFGFGFALPAYPLRGGGGNNPFNQLGATLDLSFVDGATNVGDQLGADTYTLNTDFITPEYQVAAQYAVWESGTGMVSKNFADIVTFTRASTGTYFNAAGTLTSAAINEPRFDYDPSTLAPQGLLIEESRTNSIRNNTMQGAVAGTPGTLPTNWTILGGGLGTLTQQVVGTGTSNGINYIDYRVSGTTSTTSFTLSFEQTAQIVAVNGQTWASSAWASLIGGSTTNINTLNLTIDGRTAAGSFVAVVNNLSILGVTPTLTRFTSSGTISNASIERVVLGIAFGFASGAAIDITLRIGLPQLELGAFATSVIPTTTTALTRNADVASVNTLTPWYNQSEMTFYAEYAPIYTASATVPSNTPHVLQTYTAASVQNNYAIRGVESTVTQLAVARNPTAGSQFLAVNLGGYGQAGVSRKVGYAINSSELRLATNGSLSGSLTNNAAALMATHDKMDIGSGTGGTPPYQLNGWLRRISYYPRRLSNADLQTITA